MTALDRLLPKPRLRELDTADLAVSPDRAWALVRHGNLARSKLVRALFAVRTLPGRIAGLEPQRLSLRLDDFQSSLDQPGFQVLIEDPPHEVAVGAIGKVWKPDIPFVHTAGADAFASFSEPGFIKVAWAIQLSAHGSGTRVTIELRVSATDAASWCKFRAYFLLVGPGSRFIRRSLLAALVREPGLLEPKESGPTRSPRDG